MVAWARSALPRYDTATFAPASANALVIAVPISPDPPVTNACLPEISTLVHRGLDSLHKSPVRRTRQTGAGSAISHLGQCAPKEVAHQRAAALTLSCTTKRRANSRTMATHRASLSGRAGSERRIS